MNRSARVWNVKRFDRFVPATGYVQRSIYYVYLPETIEKVVTHRLIESYVARCSMKWLHALPGHWTGVPIM